MERKIKKLEEEICEKENEVSSLKNELLKEEIYSDYVKVTEIQEKIDKLNSEIEEEMTTWENVQEELEKLKSFLYN